MNKGKTFGGLGIGLVLGTVTAVFLAEKKKDILDAVQKNFGSFSALLKPVTSRVTEQNAKEVTQYGQVFRSITDRCRFGCGCSRGAAGKKARGLG